MNEDNNWNNSNGRPDNNGWKNDGRDNNWNDRNPYGNNGGWSAPVREPNQSLYTASLVLGIITVITAMMMMVYVPYIVGGISIILAVLSRGQKAKLPSQAKIGVYLAVIGLILNTVIVGTTVYKLFNDVEYKEELNSTFEQMYGESFDDMLQDIQENGGYDL